MPSGAFIASAGRPWLGAPPKNHLANCARRIARNLVVLGLQPAAAAIPHRQQGPARITPEQARQLFALVDVLLKFSSDETGLPIKSAVKRQLTTRDAVEKYLEEKFNEDEGTKRLQRDEIVLKKFGLLDHDFNSNHSCSHSSRSRSKPITIPKPRP